MHLSRYVHAQNYTQQQHKLWTSTISFSFGHELWHEKLIDSRLLNMNYDMKSWLIQGYWTWIMTWKADWYKVIEHELWHGKLIDTMLLDMNYDMKSWLIHGYWTWIMTWKADWYKVIGHELWHEKLIDTCPYNNITLDSILRVHVSTSTYQQ